MQEFLSYFVPGLMTGAIYAMVGLGFVLIYKCSQVLNLAQGELVVIGAYIFYAFAVQLGLPLGLAICGTLGVGVILGLAVEHFALRPLIGQSVVAFIVATLAIGGLLRGTMMAVWGPEHLSLPPLFAVGGTRILGVSVSYEHLLFFVIALAILGAFTLYMNYSKTGLAMMATSEGHQIAQASGINVNTIMSIVWAIAFLLAAIGGVLLSSITGIHYSAVGFGMKVMAVVLIGGLESFPGTVVAGLLVGVVECVSAGYIDPLVGGGFREVAPFVMMLLVLPVRPYGFFGWKRIERI